MKTPITPLTPLHAIKLKCRDCCCDSLAEVRLCSDSTCPLHSFRKGTNPHRVRRIYTPEQKAAMTARLNGAKNKTPVICGEKEAGI